uniref:Uncharacterized protein n=1 Tax=Ditylenchus dipsaci TaxID=166011 RepID=A0A915CQL6_9BILA
MIAEQGLKINSLQLAARLLVSNRGEQMPMFISLCIAFFAPVAAKYFQDQVSFMENFAFDHAYLLAKLEFLVAVFKYFPKIAQTQAYLIGTMLPDFFLQLSICKKKGCILKSEQLEHKLSILCKAVKGQKEAYHKLVPFFLSCSLTGEREINFPTYVLLSICDDHDLAVLSTNLPPQEKKKYANIQAQFYSMNKIIG